MKKAIVILAAIIVSLVLLPACKSREKNIVDGPASPSEASNNSVSSSNLPSQSESQQNIPNAADAPSESEMTELREYAISFAESFYNPFTSVLDLETEDGEIGRFSFWQISYADNLEVETDGACFISKDRLTEFVEQHFGIEDYEFPINMIPQFDSDTNGYRFFPLGSGPIVSVEIVNEEQVDEKLLFAMKIIRHDFETGQQTDEQIITYHYQLIRTEGKLLLMAISAQ